MYGMRHDKPHNLAAVVTDFSRSLLFLAAVLLTVTGCSGGGGGGSGGASAPPAAVADAYTVPQAGATLSIPAPGVLANDSGNPVTAVQFTQPAHGTLTANANGAFTYTHNGDAAASDSFAYRASDGSQTSNTATVTLTINRPPLTNNACVPTPVNTTATGTVSTADPEGQPLTHTLVTQGSKGTVNLDIAGNYAYTPRANVRGMDNFTYQVTDPSGLTATGSMWVLIDGAVRIMPLGDSITQGIFKDDDGTCAAGSDNSCPPENQRIGYRKRLVEGLEVLSSGYNVDFVGQLANGSAAGLTPPDDRHEGTPGNTSGNVATNIVTWLNFNPPDVVLMHIGTNQFTTDATNVDTILTQISSWAQANYPVTVFVARIIQTVGYPGRSDANITTFNNNVAAIATDRLDVKVLMVNQQTGAVLNYSIDASSNCLNNGVCNNGDMANSLHPNPSGYNKMADKWKTDLIASGVLPDCP